MKRGPYRRTVQADIKILVLIDAGDSQKRVALLLGIFEHDVENAIRRRKRWPDRYHVPCETTLRNFTEKMR